MLLRRVFTVSPFLAISTVACNLVPAADVDFNRDVRPILSRNCFDCHGPDSKQRKADLRLDTKAVSPSLISAAISRSSPKSLRRAKPFAG